MKLRALQEKRASLVTAMQGLLAGDNLSAEQQVEWDRIEREESEVRAQIEKVQKVEGLAADLDKLKEARTVADSMTGTKDDKRISQHELAIRQYLLHGRAEMAADLREELRAQSTTAAAGGYTIPQAFSNALEVAMKYFAAVLQVAGVLETETGATLPYPTVNDTTNLASIVGEGSTSTPTDAGFGVVNFGAFTYRTLLAASEELLQDSFFDLAAFMADAGGMRIGRFLNQHLTTGSGTGQPQGVVTAAPTGVTLPSGNTVSITYDGLVDLIYSVDPMYRNNPGTALMGSDSVIKLIRKLKDSQNRPIWDAPMVLGQPDTVMGVKLIVNNDMAVPAANAKSLAFGDFTKYKVRQVRGVSVKRLDERFADNLQVGFLVFARYDARLVDAGTNPIKLLVHSAT